MSQRYFFDQDSDCHWFLVPADIRDEWRAWKDIPADDERSWTPPVRAQAIDNPLGTLTFTDPSES